MNAYLQGGKVQVATLQLLGITCLFVACKVEESTLPAVRGAAPLEQEG